jgi:hypothetical protein
VDSLDEGNAPEELGEPLQVARSAFPTTVEPSETKHRGVRPRREESRFVSRSEGHEWGWTKRRVLRSWRLTGVAVQQGRAGIDQPPGTRTQHELEDA